MRYNKAIRYSILLAFVILGPALSIDLIPRVYAANPYSLSPAFPGYAQEGGTIALVFQVNPANVSIYQFRFFVQDPSSAFHQSILENVTNFQSQFFLVVVYPSTTFPGPNSLVGQYSAWVDQIRPVPKTNVASTHFFFILTDSLEYARTQTVGIHAVGYTAFENVNVTIRPQSASTLVFSQRFPATSTGVVNTSWKIPKNSTIDSYLVTVTGTSTVKNPPDVQGFSVKAAAMTVSALTSVSSTYQRTQTMQFSFQPIYPDGSIATTGAATVTLGRPDGVNITLSAAYSATGQTFIATYKTSLDNQTGTWTATLAVRAFDDGFGNIGPDTKLTNGPQLIPATFIVSINAISYVPLGQQVKLNATIAYPDGTQLQSTGVGAYLLYTGTPSFNDTVSVTFDSGLQKWVGTYSPQVTDPGGLWSLVVKASDSPTPPNTGSATKAVTLQDHPPQAIFTSSTNSAPTGSSISFNATASYDPDGTLTTFSWTFGDGATGTGPTVNHSYSTAATYVVTLTVTDNSASTGATTSQVTITDRPPVVNFTPSATTASTGQTVTLSITASDPDGTVSKTSIDWGDGTVHTLSGAAVSDSHTYTSTGSVSSKTYTITITITDNSGQTASNTSAVIVQAASSSSGNVSLPLYYFGILAAIVAALLAGGFLAFRRHKVTHAKLKIDLEAVKSEAGRIENQEFFQSVKDQLRKDKND